MGARSKKVLGFVLVLAGGVAMWLLLRSHGNSDDRSLKEAQGIEQQAPILQGAREVEREPSAPDQPPPGRWIEVSVVDADADEPVGDVTVWASRGEERQEGKTNAAGELRLGPFAPGEIRLDVQQSGWLLAEATPRIPDGPADVQVRVLLRRGFPIAGVVFEPGDVPAVGAWIVAQQGSKEVRTDTDAEGRFRFSTLASGSWTVRVRKYFGGPFVQGVDAVAGTEDLVFRLDKALPRDLIVHVLAPDGTPVPAFDFAWAGVDGTSATGDWTGPLSVGPGSKARWVEVTNPRDAAGRPLPYGPGSVGPIASGETNLEIRLRKQEVITGHVMNAKGTPVANVQIRAWPLDRGPATGRVAGFHAEVRSDSEGAFRLARLAATAYRLLIEPGEGFAPVQPITAEVGTTDLVVQLQRGVRVELLVLDPAGVPVAEALVSVNRPGFNAFGKTDKVGRFRLPDLEAAWRYPLMVRPPSSRPDLAMLVVGAWTPKESSLRLPASMAVQGHVVDQDGKPVSGAHVNGIGQDGAKYGVTATPAGEFSLPQVSRGPILLRATKGEFLSSVVNLASGGHDITLVLRPGASLKVMFKGWPKDRSDVQAILRMPKYGYGASASVVKPTGDATFSTLDPEVTYTLFLTVGEGRRQMVAWAPALHAGAEPVEIPLKAAQSITGTVSIPRDAQQPTIKVEQGGVRAETVADRTGNFVLSGLPEGTWTVRATASGADCTYSGEVVAKTGTSIRIDMSR